jgi:hypothetical protein
MCRNGSSAPAGWRDEAARKGSATVSAIRRGGRRVCRNAARFARSPPLARPRPGLSRRSNRGTSARGIGSAGLRIQQALDLTELALGSRRGSVLVRRGKGGPRREVGMDDWGSEQLEPWLKVCQATPVGSLFCVISAMPRSSWPAVAMSSHRGRVPTHRW